MLRDAWRQERSMDPEHNTTVDLVATKRLAREIDRLTRRAVALHLAARTDLRTGGNS
jgi:hypothetical protein